LTKTGLRLRSGRTSIKMVDWDYEKKEEEDNYDGPGSERGQVSAQGSMPKIPPQTLTPCRVLGSRALTQAAEPTLEPACFMWPHSGSTRKCEHPFQIAQLVEATETFAVCRTLASAQKMS